MKISHYLPLVLVSVKCASLVNKNGAEEFEVLSILIDEIIEKAVEKYDETSEEGKEDEGEGVTELKGMIDFNNEASGLNLEIINESVIKSEINNQNEVIPVEIEKKTIQRPAPQNKFLLLFTSLIVVLVSLIISIFANK